MLRCLGCRAACPHQVLRFEADRIHGEPQRCKNWGACVRVHPNRGFSPSRN
ncbi:MAG: 4Fe-4S dicluster domain-containing protein [Treponema sp.]|nr:4Fe-4S dicluster domain-containing protein [Treponema sp.]